MLTRDNTLNIRQVTKADLEKLKGWSTNEIPDIDSYALIEAFREV